MKDLNWTALAMARKKMDPGEQIYATKLLTGWLATGTRKELYGDTIVGCHRCNGVESNNHLLQCPQKREAQRKTVTELRAYLETLRTATTVAETICNGVEEFLMEGGESAGRPTRGRLTTIASQCQSKIGWDKAMRGLLSKKWNAICFEEPDSSKHMQGDIWTSLVSVWLTRESRKYWTVRNDEMQAVSSPEEQDKSRALALAEAGVRELYAREMELPQADRGILAVPIARRLMLSLRPMQEWVQATRESINHMIAQQREREATEQPRIDVALQTVVMEEMEQSSRERQQWKESRSAKARASSELTSTAADLAVIRSNWEKVFMVQRLRQGAKEAYRRNKREQREKREREESKKLAAPQPKKKKVGRKYKSTKAAEIRQEIVKPHTQVLVDRIFRARRPKFRTDVAESAGPQVERDSPRSPTFTSLARGSEALNH
jgi:hypothetical protein